MSSPRWRIVGLCDDDELADSVERVGAGVAGAGRPESCGVGVAEAILFFFSLKSIF